MMQSAGCWSKITIIHCSVPLEKPLSHKCRTPLEICPVSLRLTWYFKKTLNHALTKQLKSTHQNLLLTFCSCVHVYVRMFEYICVCVSSCKMKGGRTFLSVAPCLHCPTVTEITGCSRTDCSWILNGSFWLLWIRNSLCHKSCKRVPWWIAWRDCHAKWHTGYSHVRAG